MKITDRVKNMAWLIGGLVIGAMIITWIENNKPKAKVLAVKRPANKVDAGAAKMEAEGFNY